MKYTSGDVINYSSFMVGSEFRNVTLTSVMNG